MLANEEIAIREIRQTHSPDKTVKVLIHGHDMNGEPMIDECFVTPEEARRFINSEFHVTLAPGYSLDGIKPE